MTEWILFVQLFAGLLLIPGEDASCAVELIPPRVVVKHGDPVSVNCSTSASDVAGVGWEASQGGTGIREQRSVMWTVESLIHWDISPKCFLTDIHGKQCLTKLDLVIYTFPETISISSSAELNEGIRENVEYNFTCSILNIAPVQNLMIRWYEGDALIHTNTLQSDQKKPTNQTSVHSFTPTRQHDGTTIRCKAHMDLGPEGPKFNASSQELNIKVLFGPYIECNTIEVQEGESLEGKCNVTGNPPPSVVWLKDGHPVNLTDPLRRNDTGTYDVKADAVEEKIQVDVHYGPEWMCPDTFTASEYRPHNLICSQGFPEPQEIWYKDHEEVKLPDILTRRDAGQYWVTVSNNLTTLNYTVDIVVHYPPSHIVELEDSEVKAGEGLVLKCSSAGNPRLNYSWTYYKTENVNERTEDGVSALVINNANGFNIGSYTCHAWNERGNVSKTVRVTVKGAEQECPIEIQPDTMVLEYQSRGQAAVCKPRNADSNVKEIFWQIQPDRNISNESWKPDVSKDWDLSPVCHGDFKGIGRCNKTLLYILYKPPENVSIDTKDNSTSTVEGGVMELKCSIKDVAPAENLKVQWTWQKGNETVELGSVGANNASSCSFPKKRSPVNVECYINITLNRTHHGTEVRCEAELDLGPKGPQPPPTANSYSFILNVSYKPKINTTKLPKSVPVIRGYKEELVCEADGNPPPKIQWHYSSRTAFLGSNGTLIVNEEGTYNCTAENYLSRDTHVVQVELKEDYLPLLAGFVALTVVGISVIFVTIYSIYYKNTKMRRYSLKNPKLSTLNGNVAHNTWDIQLPVTKLS